MSNLVRIWPMDSDSPVFRATRKATKIKGETTGEPPSPLEQKVPWRQVPLDICNKVPRFARDDLPDRIDSKSQDQKF